jgi:hypothetical protein
MTSHSVEELNTIAKETIALLKKEFVFEDGSFFLEKSSKGIFATHIYPDIGDYLPFFLYFGEINFIDLHIQQLKKSLKKNIFVSELPTFGINNLAKSYEYTDLLLGILDYHDFVKSAESKKMIIDYSNEAIKIFNLNSEINSFYHFPTGLKIPIFDTRDGTLIETYVDLYKQFGDVEYLNVAENIYRNLIRGDVFKKQGILPEFDASRLLKSTFDLLRGKKFKTITICKNNTNSLFGLLSLYKINKNEEVKMTIDRIVSAIINTALVEGGGIAKHASETKEAFLTASFSMIDFLCDMYFFTRECEYLDDAKKIAGFWIGKQGKTGLFPVLSLKKESFLDSETDMTIALYKLYELTGDVSYKNSAERCFQGVLDFHVKNGFPLGVDVDTGDVVNGTQRTKFIALFLKVVILKIYYCNDESIYKNEWLHSILRDR